LQLIPTGKFADRVLEHIQNIEDAQTFEFWKNQNKTNDVNLLMEALTKIVGFPAFIVKYFALPFPSDINPEGAGHGYQPHPKSR
jgi:hypothetical protein